MTPLVLNCKSHSQTHKKNEGAEEGKQEIVPGTNTSSLTRR